MRRPSSYTALEELGRVRLSRHFFMRNFLYSEIGNFFGKPNIPDDPDTAIAAGRGLATHLLDPLVETFGPIEVRSGLRSQVLNHFGATQVKPQKCSSNEKTVANHIWDQRDANGHLGACVSVVVPWFADRYEQGRDWRDLAWWVHDHLPYSQMYFFPKLAAFNLTWSEAPQQSIGSYIAPKGLLLRAGQEPDEPLKQRQDRYADFPPLRGISYPQPTERWLG
ncbi:MAG: hypothetical protein OXR62_09535 [Ahrensia sp.]|nr:hypothetical protein [Ahrensia sp.]